jgi:hypothetical protein
VQKLAALIVCVGSRDYIILLSYVCQSVRWCRILCSQRVFCMSQINKNIFAARYISLNIILNNLVVTYAL